MAKVKYNVVTHGVTGIVGDLLEFRQRYGKTVIAKIADRKDKKTPAQLLVRKNSVAPLPMRNRQ